MKQNHLKKYTFLSLEIVCFIGLALLASNCNSRPDTLSHRALKLGTLLPLTGDLSSYGTSMQDSASLLIETVNACGGVMGKPVKLVAADDQSEPQVGAEAIAKLTEIDNVAGVIGGATSATSAAAVDIAVLNQVVMISPSSTSPLFTERAIKGDFNGFWFRTAPPDTFQGPILARLMQQKGYQTVSILAVNNDYGKGLVNAFIPAFEALNGKIFNKSNLSLYAPNAVTFNSEVFTAFENDPDAILLIDYSQTGSLVIRSIYEQGLLNKAALVLSDGFKDDELAQNVGKTPGGQLILTTGATILGTSPSAKGVAYTAFRSLYQKAYPGREPVIYDANTWDSAAVLVLAAELAQSNQGGEIKEYIRTVSNPPGKKVTDVCVALDAIRKGESINYEGAGSNVGFDPQGDVQGNYDLWTIDNDGNIKIIDFIKGN